MLGTIQLGEAPSFSRVFPLILLFLRLSGIPVSFQGRTASPAVHVSASHPSMIYPERPPFPISHIFLDRWKRGRATPPDSSSSPRLTIFLFPIPPARFFSEAPPHAMAVGLPRLRQSLCSEYSQGAPTWQHSGLAGQALGFSLPAGAARFLRFHSSLFRRFPAHLLGFILLFFILEGLIHPLGESGCSSTHTAYRLEQRNGARARNGA